MTRIFRMRSRCGHRCKSTPIWRTQLVRVMADTVSTHPCPRYSCSWHDNWTTSMYGPGGFGAASAPQKSSPHQCLTAGGDECLDSLAARLRSSKGHVLHYVPVPSCLANGVTGLMTLPLWAAFPPLLPPQGASWDRSPHELPALDSSFKVGLCGTPA